MNHSNDEQCGKTSSIKESLKACKISLKDYDDLIQALVLAGSKDREAHAIKKIDSRGCPVANAGVMRVFEGATIVAEDRGSVYAVWINRINEKGQTEEVVCFAEFPWK